VRRRSLVTATLAATLFAPERASAQQPSAKIPRVGFLSSAGSEKTRLLGAFREGLRDHGYVEGRNVILDLRFGGGDLTHELKMAAELVNLPVDVIVTEGVPSNAVDPSGQIPIVAPALMDPVERGFAASLARPGGNITGFTLMHTEARGRWADIAAWLQASQFFHLKRPPHSPKQPRPPHAPTGHNRPRDRCRRPFAKPAAVSERGAPKFSGPPREPHFPRTADSAGCRCNGAPDTARDHPRRGSVFPNEPYPGAGPFASSQRLRASSSSVTPRTTVAATAPPARSAARQFFSARGEFPQNRPLSTRGGPLLGGGGHYSLKIRRKCDLPHIRGLRRVLSSEWCSLIRSRTLRCRQRRSTGGISTCFVTAVRSAPDRNHRR